MTPTSIKAVVRAKLGKVIYLPFHCGRYNSDGSSLPMWKNGHGRDIVISGPEVDSVPRDLRKYVLYGDTEWLRAVGDCSHT